MYHVLKHSRFQGKVYLTSPNAVVVRDLQYWHAQFPVLTHEDKEEIFQKIH